MVSRLLMMQTSLALAIVIAIPPQATVQQDGLTYVPQPGDSLRDVSLFFGIAPDELIGKNDMQGPMGMKFGVDLVVPVTVYDQEIGLPNTTTTYIVQRGDTLFRIATMFNIPADALADANDIPWVDRIYVGQILTIPTSDYQVRSLDDRIVDSVSPMPSDQIPEPTVVDGKQIVVVLSQQQTYVFENGVLLRHFLSSTGLPRTPTVTGDFEIYVKYDAQRMTGPGYDLPGVPWVMYFYRDYALHGAYWHNNFGNPMSHGCVNLRIPEAEWLYQWAAIGTPVHIIP